ncbi:MAG: prepilin-type N-terminal cleavage/methylation domain-containing protein [Armatimonadetes bacterium]|nr:prepilin-type N-terminal cleavage/methylation domain-containing protein [Armatimonadota bacterium]
MVLPDGPARRPACAFTLIELLVVIAIIALLAAILFPVFARSREQARKTRCLANLKQSTHAFLMYAEDYDEMFPCRDNEHLWGQWRPLLAAYVKTDDLLWCPSDLGLRAAYNGVSGYFSSYLYCYALYNPVAAVNSGTCWEPKVPHSLAEVTAPAGKDLLFEQYWNTAHDGDDDPNRGVWLHFSFVDGHAKYLNRQRLEPRAVPHDPNWTRDGAAGVDFK